MTEILDAVDVNNRGVTVEKVTQLAIAVAEAGKWNDTGIVSGEEAATMLSSYSLGGIDMARAARYGVAAKQIERYVDPLEAAAWEDRRAA